LPAEFQTEFSTAATSEAIRTAEDLKPSTAAIG